MKNTIYYCRGVCLQQTKQPISYAAAHYTASPNRYIIPTTSEQTFELWRLTVFVALLLLFKTFVGIWLFPIFVIWLLNACKYPNFGYHVGSGDVMQRSFRAVGMNGQKSGGKSCLLWNCWDGRQCRVRVCGLILICIMPPSRQLRQNNDGAEIKLFKRHFDYSSSFHYVCNWMKASWR